MPLFAYMLVAMANLGREPSTLLRRWESLRPPVQGAITYPPFAAVLFVLNLGLFNQPLVRSVLYGLIEALPLTAFLLIATANERRKRRPSEPEEPADR